MSRLILVSGAGASGKSEYAEKLAVDMHEDRLIYVATMSAYDDYTTQLCLEALEKYIKKGVLIQILRQLRSHMA